MTAPTELRLVIGNPAAEIVTHDSHMEIRTPANGLALKVAFGSRKSSVRIEAAKDIASADEFYWYQSGSLLAFSDNFHDIAACVPLSERKVPTDAVVDHFLFRTVPGERSYLSGVKRLGNGNSLTWINGQTAPSIRQAQPIIAEPSADYLKDIEQFLDAELAAMAGPPGTSVNMLSGGVDSTLIQSFLGPGIESVSAALDAPEFAHEIEYAREASQLLGSTHHFIPVRESEWRQDIESAICAAGLPPQPLQTALIHRILEWPARRFISGYHADGLFGLRILNDRNRSSLHWKLRGFQSAVEIAAADLLNRPRAIRAVRYWSKPAHPYGLAGRYASFTEIGLVAEVFGKDAVTRALSDRIDYAMQRIGGELPTGIDGHYHLGHWIDFYCEDTMSIWKQLGFSRGKEMVSPFRTLSAIRTALSIPARDRYVSDRRLKYLLKDLLRKRLPLYRADQEKGHSGLPQARLIRDGALDLDERYPVPDYLAPIQSAIARTGKANCIETMWNFFAIALWHKHVVANAALAPHASSRVFSYGISRDDRPDGMV